MLRLSVVENRDGAKVQTNINWEEVQCIGKRTKQNSGVLDQTLPVQAAFDQGPHCFAILIKLTFAQKGLYAFIRNY
jgi:hypothetical protein